MGSPNAGAPRSVVLFLGFAGLGVGSGLWQVLLASLTLRLGLTPAPLGLALNLGALSGIAMSFVSSRLVERVGERGAIAAGALLFGAGIGGHAGVTSYGALVGSLLVYGAGASLFDIAINAAAAAHEQATGRLVLGALHACFSGAAALGALVTGGLLAAGLPFRTLYLAGGLGVAATALAVLLLAGSRARPQLARTASMPGGSFLRPGPVLLLACMTLAAFFGESTMESWSGLYLRQNLGVTVAVGASGVACFHLAMLVGRVAAARAIRRVDKRRWLAGAAVIGMVGIVLATGSTSAPVAIGGLLLVGLGLSSVAPVAFSLAGDVAPTETARACATIASIGYVGSLVGPGVIGSVASVWGLRWALTLVAPALLAIAVLASFAREK